MSTNGKGLRVLSVQAEKIQRLEFVDLKTPDANMVEITGGNENGKSSVLDTIRMAMGGKSATSIDPVKKGSDKGKIVIDLGKYLLTKTITRKGEYLRIESKDGAVYKSPQQLIDSWKNDFSLDPLAFANARPEIQRAMLMKAISLPVSGERIKELAGVVVKVDENNPLAAIEAAKKEVEGLRKEKGRDLKREKGAADAIVIPAEMESVERVDAQEIIKAKEVLQEKQRANDAERDKLTLIKTKGQTQKQKMSNLRDREKDLEEQIKKLQERLAALNAQVLEADQEYESLKGKYQEQEKVVSALQDPDFSELDRKIEEAQRINQVVFQREQKVAHLEAKKAAQAEYDAYSDKLMLLQQYREELLANAKLPVPGLSISEDGVVTYQDIPVSQRGKSKRILIGLAVCAALKPQVRVVLVYDGNDIDQAGMEIVYDWAKANDFQVWVERIQNSGKGGVAFEISEGKVKPAEMIPPVGKAAEGEQMTLSA